MSEGSLFSTHSLLSYFSCVWLCATPETAAHQAPPSLGFSRQEHWSGLPFPSPMHESEKWKWSCSVVSDPQQPHGLQPTRLLHSWDFPGWSTGVGCHCLLPNPIAWPYNNNNKIYSIFGFQVEYGRLNISIYLYSVRKTPLNDSKGIKRKDMFLLTKQESR